MKKNIATGLIILGGLTAIMSFTSKNEVGSVPVSLGIMAVGMFLIMKK